MLFGSFDMYAVVSPQTITCDRNPLLWNELLTMKAFTDRQKTSQGLPVVNQ